MIISRSPLRISLFGGGTDLPDFYRKFSGSVLSFSINRYVFVALHEKFDSGYRISYSINENVAEINEIKHPLVKNSLIAAGVDTPLEITSIAEIPSRGSGLGSSSAFTVSLLRALYQYKDIPFDNFKLAFDACRVEIDMSGEPIGKQDQYGCAIGGFKFIEFHKNDSVNCEILTLKSELIKDFLDHSLLFYTGITRNASQLLHEQRHNTLNNFSVINNLNIAKEQSLIGRELLYSGELEGIGKLLNEGWQIKKSFNPKITNSIIENGYTKAMNAGAWGGKLLGAGGGGFMFFMAPKSEHDSIQNSLREWRRIPFEIDFEGSRTLMVEGN